MNNEVKSKKTQDHTSNVVDCIFRKDAQRAKVTPTANSTTARKPTILESFIKIIIIMVSSLQVLYPSKHYSKLSQVMTFHWVSVL